MFIVITTLTRGKKPIAFTITIFVVGIILQLKSIVCT